MRRMGGDIADGVKPVSLVFLLSEDDIDRINAQRAGCATRFSVESVKSLNPVLNALVIGFLNGALDSDLLSLSAAEYEAIIPKPRSLGILEKSIANCQFAIDNLRENTQTLKDVCDNPAIPALVKPSMQAMIETNGKIIAEKEAELTLAIARLTAETLEYAKKQEKKDKELAKAKAKAEKDKKVVENTAEGDKKTE